MLANGEEPEVIRDKLDVPAGEIVQALRGWEEEARPLAEMSDQAVEALIDDEIGGFIRLTMGRYTPEARREFSDQLLVELAAVPYSLLGVAMAEARKRISYPERLVPFVFEFVEHRFERLRAEGERLGALVRIAGGDGR